MLASVHAGLCFCLVCDDLVHVDLVSLTIYHEHNWCSPPLQNFLFASSQPDSELKMIDFGLSKHFKVGESHCERVGTPYTLAPEIIRGTYDEKCDVWSLGVITYLLLCGDSPFGGLDGESLLVVKENM